MPGPTQPASPVLPPAAARRLLMSAHGLLADPARRATPATVYRQIESMGFVQVDTIQTVERAHHHILFTRFDDYHPRMLGKLLERDRRLFEHWTHDASCIPVTWLPHWTERFAWFRRRAQTRRAHYKKRVGEDLQGLAARVRRRLEREGPLMSKDLEAADGPKHHWWGSHKPERTAIQYLWSIGEVTVARRVNFHKVYDLMARVFPDFDPRADPDPDEHVEWACRTALDRLVVATPTELANWLGVIDGKAARRWCEAATATGEIVAVTQDTADGSKPRRVYARGDWETRLRRAPDPPARLRVLSPFDPVIRDRNQTQRVFDFDYTLEAFVPKAKRKYGHFVLPLLEGERLIGRVDPRLDRANRVLEINGLWWENGIAETGARRRELEQALELFARQIGADRVTLPAKPKGRERKGVSSRARPRPRS
jgi:uncharacterized protein YcaQ